MKASLRNSSVLALSLLAVVATGQQTSQRAKAAGIAKPQASKAPAASTVKRPLRALAGADTCPGTPITLPLPFNDTGDTSVATTNDVGSNDVSCASLLPSPTDPGPDQIYSFTILGPGNGLTITVTNAGLYDTSIYVLSTCGDGTSCVAYSDTIPSNPTEVITLPALAAGTYYLYIDSWYSTNPADGSPRFDLARAQGAYTVSIDGSLGTVNTPTPTDTPTVTNTPTITNTPTVTDTPTVTNTPTPTNTGTVTPTTTFTATNTPTASPTVTSTPVSTSTPVPTLTPTPFGTGGPAGPATPIPTLSGWMLAAFAAALVAVALFLTRRS